MNRTTPLKSNTRPRHPRQGFAIIMVIAFYAISVALIGVWVRSAISRQQQVKRWQEKTQVTWLAEAGLRRAVARLAVDSAYAGEVWQIEGDDLGTDSPAEVEIRIDPLPQAADDETSNTASTPERVTIVAIARYPANQPTRAQQTKTARFRKPALIATSGESS